jgi:hypothetical protein
MHTTDIASRRRRALGAAALCDGHVDPRTIESHLAGKPVRGARLREEIETALRAWDAMVIAYERAQRASTAA